jgi:ABC-type microcin C transport system duplicated ATPase subunit YejF
MVAVAVRGESGLRRFECGGIDPHDAMRYATQRAGGVSRQKLAIALTSIGRPRR